MSGRKVSKEFFSTIKILLWFVQKKDSVYKRMTLYIEVSHLYVLYVYIGKPAQSFKYKSETLFCKFIVSYII